MQGPLEAGFNKISSFSFLTRICAKSCKDLLEDCTRISTRSSHKDLQKNLTKIFLPGPLQRSSQEHPGRAFIQATLCKILMQGLPREDLIRICTRSSEKDLYKIMQGSVREDFTRTPQNLLIRTPARSCNDLLEDVSRIFTRSPHKDPYTIMQGHQDLHNIFSQGHLRPLVKIFIHCGPLRLQGETLARSS